MTGFLNDIGAGGIADIVLMSAVIYALLVWFKKSKAASVLTGILIIGVVYLLARQFNLLLTAAVLQSFFTVILLAVIIIFQEDLKYLFERLALWRYNRGSRRRKLHDTRREVEMLARTLTDFAREKIGALIVLRGADIVDRHINNGVDLNGDLSEALLKSLFDPHSIGHDGAVLIEGDRVLQFSCHLPLSKDLQKVGRSGTRHAAALGLAEVTDALCFAVSEEQGTISAARNGEIATLKDPQELTNLLEAYYQERYPEKKSNALGDIFRKNIPEKIMAVAVTMVLWYVFVHESRITFERFSIPVEMTNLSDDLEMKAIRPKEVEVTLSGKRSAFYFFNKKELRLYMNMLDEKTGTDIRQIQESELTVPPGVSLERISPTRVQISIVTKGKN